MSGDEFITMLMVGVAVYFTFILVLCGLAHIVYGFMGLHGKDHECIIHRPKSESDVTPRHMEWP
jgi:hypothetical protein